MTLTNSLVKTYSEEIKDLIQISHNTDKRSEFQNRLTTILKVIPTLEPTEQVILFDQLLKFHWNLPGFQHYDDPQFYLIDKVVEIIGFKNPSIITNFAETTFPRFQENKKHLMSLEMQEIILMHILLRMIMKKAIEHTPFTETLSTYIYDGRIEGNECYFAELRNLWVAILYARPPANFCKTANLDIKIDIDGYGASLYEYPYNPMHSMQEQLMVDNQLYYGKTLMAFQVLGVNRGLTLKYIQKQVEIGEMQPADYLKALILCGNATKKEIAVLESWYSENMWGLNKDDKGVLSMHLVGGFLPTIIHCPLMQIFNEKLANFIIELLEKVNLKKWLGQWDFSSWERLSPLAALFPDPYCKKIFFKLVTVARPGLATNEQLAKTTREVIDKNEYW